jgi:hypothetical protein
MPQSPDFRYDVFLSHNTGDKPQVCRLAERLKKAGLRVWFDEWVMRPGDDIYVAIEHGLGAAWVQVLCLSPAALGSDWVTLERSTVLFRDPTNAGRRFIPLVPDRLRTAGHAAALQVCGFPQGSGGGVRGTADSVPSRDGRSS